MAGRAKVIVGMLVIWRLRLAVDAILSVLAGLASRMPPAISLFRGPWMCFVRGSVHGSLTLTAKRRRSPDCRQDNRVGFEINLNHNRRARGIVCGKAQ
jgi:hypothetical protein